MMRKYLTGEAGGVTIQMLFFSVVFFILGGLAVDVSNAYRMRTTMQATADAAAIAGARELPTEADAKTTAATYVELNMPTSVHGTLAQPTDYVVGNWDIPGRRFEAGATPHNALQVNLTRSDSYGNPLSTFLLKFVGMDAWDIKTKATALYDKPIACAGIISETYVKLQKTNNVGSGYCVFARDYVEANSELWTKPGSVIGTTGPLDFRPGSDNNLNHVTFTEDIHADRALNIKSVINDWIDDFNAGRPAPFGYTFEMGLPEPESMGTKKIYLVNGNSDSWGSNSTPDLTDVIIAVTGEFKVGSNARIINAQDCTTRNPIGIFAGNGITFGQGYMLDGVDLISGKTITMGQNGRVGVSSGIIMEAVKEISTGSGTDFSGCIPLDLGFREELPTLTGLVQ